MSSPAPVASPPLPAADNTAPPPVASTPPAPAALLPPAAAPPLPAPPPTNTTPPTSAPPPQSSPPPSIALTPPAPSPPPSIGLTPPAPSPPSPPSPVPPPATFPSPPNAIPPSGSVVPPPPTHSSGGGSPPAPRTPPSRGSPPSPTRNVSPPSPSGTRGSPSSSGDSSGISIGLVVGVAIGGIAILLILTLFCLCCKKKRKRLTSEYNIAPPPPGPKADSYAAPVQNWQHNVPQPPDHMVMAPPKLSPVPAGASRPPPPQYSPPPPPPFLSSSGGSASNYSGAEVPAPPPPPSPGMALGFSRSTFTYEELALATDGFSNAKLLGQGGFGYVHKGMLPNGKEVAVKQLKAGSGQGEREFQAEVEIISRVHHRHLVSLVGYCIAGTQRLLVYEFAPNNTLEFHLHGKGRPVMDWPTRLKIALGSAKGLAYLHEDCHPKIIHRDIKASNILLDFNFEAKVADFGLAKFSSDLKTHISTRVMGTFGYLAPEYASSGKLTDKSDVFSFGVVLLELITGRRPVDSSQSYMDDSLVDWARPLLTRALEEGNFDALTDPRLGNNYNHNEMSRMVASAAACVRHSARRRPRLSQVVRALEGDVSLAALNEGIRPGQSTLYSSYGSSDYDASQYNEDLHKFRKVAMGSHEYGSSDQYSNPTSEYGLNPSESSSEGKQMEKKRAN